MFRILAALTLGMLLTPALYAQTPVDGTWNFTMSSPFGSVDATVTLVTDGDQLRGDFDMGEGRKLVIENGTVNGNTIAFRITREGLMTMTYEMNAALEGDSINGTAAAMGTTAPWSMSRGS